MIAGLAGTPGHSSAIVGRESELMNLRPWEHMPVVSMPARPVVAIQAARAGNAVNETSRLMVPASDLRMGQRQGIGVPPPLTGWMNSNRRTPVKTMQPLLPRIAR